MTSATVHPGTLSALLDWYATLTPESLDALDRFYAPQAHFRDPFNDVRGHAAIRAVFAHMFEAIVDPRFLIDRKLMGDREGFATWTFTGAIQGRRFSVPGSSHLRFGDDGRVSDHQDYWDAAALWCHLSLIGPPVAWLQRRFATPLPR